MAKAWLVCLALVISFSATVLSKSRYKDNTVNSGNEILNDLTLQSVEDMIQHYNERLLDAIRSDMSDMQRELKFMRKSLKLERTRQRSMEEKMDTCVAQIQECERPPQPTPPLPEPSTTRVTLSACPEDFVKFEDHCYMFARRGMKWAQAKSFCEDRGSYLVSVNTQAEQDFLDAKIREYNIANVWIGMTLESDKPMWMDGTEVSFTHWGPKEPNCMKSLGCGVFISQFLDYYWEDANKFYKYNPLCELSLLPGDVI